MTNLNPNALGPLYEACKAMYPHLADVVDRGQTPGHDTSHYGDARAVVAARDAIRLAESPSPVGDERYSTTDELHTVGLERQTAALSAELAEVRGVLAEVVEAAKASLAQFQYMLEQMRMDMPSENEPYIGASSEVSTRMDELHAALARAATVKGAGQ